MTLAFGLFDHCSLGRGVYPLTIDLCGFVDLEDVLGVLFRRLDKLLDINWLFEVFEKVMDLLILLANGKDLILFQGLELREFFVKITLKLKDNLLEELDLGALTSVSVKLLGLINELVDVFTFNGYLDFIDTALCLHNMPMDLFHALDITLLTTLLQGS